MPQTVSIEGWAVPPADDVLEKLLGSVLNVPVDGPIGGGPIGEFFRFARVIIVTLAPTEGPHYTCGRCDSPARCCLTVEWEAGYENPGGNLLCEQCVDGVVIAGAEVIPFGSQPASQAEYSVTVNYDLTRLGGGDA